MMEVSNLKNKKGMSKIVTTVLFISLAIILTVIIIAVVTQLIGESGKEAGDAFSCVGVGIYLEEIKGCSSSFEISVERDDLATNQINGVKVVFKEGGATEEFFIDEVMSRDDSATSEKFEFEKIEEPESVTAFPFVGPSENRDICTKQGVRYDLERYN